MLSEEEIIKEVKGYLDFEEGISMRAIQGLLDLYNKEKEKNKGYKDKIKAKIEEIENEDKKYKNYLKDGRENFIPEYVWARPVLQSLLEEGE